MKVFCYFEECNVNPDAGWLLNRWADNWRKAGFDPVVLTLRDAMEHPQFRELDAIFNSFPTVNPKAYERANFRRWCAYAMRSGLAVDYDLFHLSLDPFEPTELVFMDRNRVPCAVAGRALDFELVLQWFRDYRMDIDDHISGRPHISDMMVTTRHRDAKTMDWVKEYGEDKPAKLIHFPNDACGGSKRRAIERYFGV